MAPMQEGQAHRQDRVRRRDAALHRISLTRRWIVVGAAGLTAGFAALVSAILPGKSLGAKVRAPAASTAASSTASPALPAPASADQLGVGSASSASQPSISPPPAAPQPSAPAAAPQPSAPAPAVSGGS